MSISDELKKHLDSITPEQFEKEWQEIKDKGQGVESPTVDEFIEMATHFHPEIVKKTCIYCAGDVHEKRIAILEKNGKPITCITCAEQKVQKVTGFQVNHDKACREIQVCSPEEGARLKKMERKTGQATGGPGMGRNAGKIVYKG